MKKRLQGLVAGMLIGALLLGGATFAKQVSEKVDIFYNNIKIFIDGTELIPKDANGNAVEPFIMNGTTYLPVRAVANAFGKDVDWDGETQTVYLGAKPGENKYGRSNPAPIGTAQTVTLSTNDADWNVIKYTANVVVNEVYRGNEAWELLKNANMFNSEPDEGKEYILIKVKISVNGLPDDLSANISQAMFNFYSTDYTKYNDINICVVPDNKNINTNVYNGGMVEGYVCKEITLNDATPSVAFGQDLFGNGGIWFSLTK